MARSSRKRPRSPEEAAQILIRTLDTKEIPMHRYLLLMIVVLLLTACNQQALQPAQATAQAVINEVGPTAKAAIEQVGPTVRALVPTPIPAATPDPRYPNTLDRAIIACFAPGCAAEAAIILPAGTHYQDTGPDSETWRFIEIEGGGQVWVVRSQLTKG
jgi:hypothetical protein